MKSFFKKAVILAIGFIMVFGPLSGCKKPQALAVHYEDNDEFYTIKWYAVSGMTSSSNADFRAVMNEVNAYLGEKLNCALDYIPESMWNYSDRMNTLFSANSKLDLCWTSPQINNYALNVQRQNFLPLEGLIDDYAPTIKSLLDDRMWEQAKIDGHIYGAINRQILPRTAGFLVDKNLASEFLATKGTDFDNAYTILTADYDAFDLMTDYMQWLKDNSKGWSGMFSYLDPSYILQLFYGMDDLGTDMSTPGVVRISDTAEGGIEIVNQFDTPEYRRLLEIAETWKAKGFINLDTAADRGNEPSKNDVTWATTWKPYNVMPTITQYPGEKLRRVDYEVLRLGSPNYFTSFIIGTMSAISSTSENPARVMKFLELLASDEYLHNLIQFGIKDKTYTENEQGQVTMKENSGWDNSLFGWTLGDEFIGKVMSHQDVDVWEKYKTINDEAYVSDIIGFTFDASDVTIRQAISNCQSVYLSYAETLGRAGYEDNEAKYQEFLGALNAAGAKTVIEEKQKQLDAWLAAKAN